VNDSSYVGNLRVGLYAESITTAPVTARFDNFRFSELGAIMAVQTLSVPLVVAPADSSEFSYGPAR